MITQRRCRYILGKIQVTGVLCVCVCVCVCVCERERAPAAFEATNRWKGDFFALN